MTDVFLEHPLLARLEPLPRERLLKAATERQLRAKRPVLKEGDPPDHVFFLVEGAVRVFHRTPDNRKEVLVKLFKAPAMFGEMEVLVGRPFLEHVRTLEASKLLLLPSEAFLEAVRQSPSFTSGLLTDMSARLCIATCNERALAFCELDSRLVNLFLDYADLCGQVQSDGRILLATKLSQQSLADDLAVSRRAVGTSLEKLKNAGLVVRRSGRWIISSRSALQSKASKNLGLYFRSDDGPFLARRPL